MQSPRAFSLFEFTLGPGIANALINAPLGWFLLKPGAILPLWGIPCIAADVVAMSFGVAFGTALVVTPQVRKRYERGQLRMPALSPRLRAIYFNWPENLFHRSFNCGLLGVALFAPLPLLALWGSGSRRLRHAAFALFKGVFGFVEGAIVTPLIAAGALLMWPTAAGAGTS